MSRTYNSTPETITLDCGVYRHTVDFTWAPPKIGDVIWCVRCRRERTVIAAPPQLRVRCRNCRYSRTFGRGLITAEAKAAAHRARYPTHTVEILDGRRLLSVFAPPSEREAPTLPLTTDMRHGWSDVPQF